MASIHKLTISTRLSDRDSAELMDYLSEWRTDYGEMLRYTWYHYARVTPRPGRADFNTELQRLFHVTKRTANSVIDEAQGRYNALVELKKTEREQLKTKIKSLEDSIEKLKKEVSDSACLAATNKLSEEMLVRYRGKKRSLFYKKQKLNKLKNRLLQRERDEASKKYGICFGTKKRFKAQTRLSENGYPTKEAWKKDFVEHRDASISYLGSKGESCCNQTFQLTRCQDGSYSIQCRKDGRLAGSKRQYVYGKCRFPYLGEKLAELLREGTHGITYRIKFVGEKIYLQAVLSYDKANVITNMCDGAIGLDYNDGFIQMSETDGSGNLINQDKFDLKLHGTGKKAESEIREAVAAISFCALMTGKSIVCEDLDFVKLKSKTQNARSKRGKRYNRMIHLFDYSRYKSTLINSCVRRQIDLVFVSPVNTSKIAKKKYCGKRKLNIHAGAAYVIARRGQGFIDKLPACR